MTQHILHPGEEVQRPFWSVIVPLYNRRDYLKQCLTSVLEQYPGPKEMEIIVIDDASKNDMRSFVEDIGGERVKYIRNSANLGLYPSTNAAIRQARGNWLHILHDDDWVLPGFYAAMRRGVESLPESVGVGFSMYRNEFEGRGSSSHLQFRSNPGLMGRSFLAMLARENPLQIPAVIYRRETFARVGLFREDIPFTADWEWYVRSAREFSWYHEPTVLACYRVHASNQTHDLRDSGRRARDIRHTIEIFARILPADMIGRVVPYVRQLHACRFLGFALVYAENGKPQTAARYLLEALALDPDTLLRPEFAKLLQSQALPSLRLNVSQMRFSTNAAARALYLAETEHPGRRNATHYKIASDQA